MSTAPPTDLPPALPPAALDALAQRVLKGHRVTREEALAVAQTPDEDLLALVHAASRLRRAAFGRQVRVHVLQNAKSGVCTEDCAFCSQSLAYNTEDRVPKYGMQDVDDLVAGADRAVAAGAVTYCMVTATRGPKPAEVDRIGEAARRIKERHPQLRLCASLGLLAEGQAEALKAWGVDRYNHNLETSARHFPAIVSTHGVQERMATVRRAAAAGLEACCGGIVGMGEQVEDRVDLALELRDLGVDSVPLNFLDPRPGTPLAAVPRLSPADCLRTLAAFRFVHPRTDLRLAGGREVALRSLQPLALHVANSMFTDGYLTTPGAAPSADLQMVRDAGFEPAAVGDPVLATP
jgi:biotin synthase